MNTDLRFHHSDFLFRSVLTSLKESNFLDAGRLLEPLLSRCSDEVRSAAKAQRLKAVTIQEHDSWSFDILRWREDAVSADIQALYAMAPHFDTSFPGDRSTIGDFVRRAKIYSLCSPPPDPTARLALYSLAGLIGGTIVVAKGIHVVVNVPKSSVASLNDLPRKLAWHVSETVPNVKLAPPDSLKKKRKTLSAKGQSDGQDWWRQMQGAVAAAPAMFEGRNVLVIDDVIGTGVTMFECARALTQVGAHSVYGLALTKTSDPIVILGDTK